MTMDSAAQALQSHRTAQPSRFNRKLLIALSFVVSHPACVQNKVLSLPFESSSSARASSEQWLL
jgi:hypothetical protein